MAETAKKISMIPAKVQYDRNVKLSEKKMKVAAYCRVSTELEEQDSSYEAQVEYYTSKISENENWKNAGIYADDGKSGTNTKKRADFNAMIQDALAGKIDMILTKSVSRFARNTVDSLVTIRKLKEKNVAVVFEANLVSPIVVIVISFTALCSFAIPNEEFATAFRLLKFFFIGMCAWLGYFGMLLGLLFVLIHLAHLKSFGIPYLMPFVGADLTDYEDERDFLWRWPIRKLTKRPIYARREERVKLKLK